MGNQADVSAALSYPQDKMAKIIDKFWQIFSGVKSYQDKVIMQYNDLLYVESLTGFRRYAPIEQNQIINSPIQGTASDITVKAMELLSEKSVFSEAVEEILYTMAFEVLDYFPFMSVPLLVEAARGNNWQEMEDFIERDSTYYGYKRK